MGIYADYMLPRLIARTMRHANFAPYRQRVVSLANGRVLEVGIGAGANLPFYPAEAREIIGIEPSPRLTKLARRAASTARAPVSFLDASAEAIPLDDGSIDSVVLTWTLCSIRDANRALGEMRRVLKQGGRLLFAEHGLAPDPRVQKWQHRLTPLWKRVAGGCHLDRAITILIENAGFQFERVDTGFMQGPRPLTYMYEGAARKG